MNIPTDKLEWAMASLLPKDRDAIELRADGWTFRAIASALGGVTRERARQRVLKAQRHLRTKLTSHFYELTVGI